MNKFFLNFRFNKKGISLIETLVAVSVFVLIALSVYQVYILISNSMYLGRLKITATALANEQFEIIRNMPFSDVGISGGIPNGILESNRVFVRDGVTFYVNTYVRNIDDSFDGLIGDPVGPDLSPADYKLVEIEIACPSCRNFSPVNFTTNIMPIGLEATSTNGALFIRVIDAEGKPLEEAKVHIENNTIIPAIVIDDVTDENGYLRIIDTPPGVNAYEITVTSDKPSFWDIGYSEDKTYPVDDPANPNPSKAHATVVSQDVTNVTLVIDELSKLDFEAINDSCDNVSSVDFNVSGGKLIGEDPDVYKFSEGVYSAGEWGGQIKPIEWGRYDFISVDANKDIVGTIPPLPITINPGAYHVLNLIVEDKNPNSVLVNVLAAGTLLPLAEAEVRLQGVGYDETVFTGRGTMGQIDWSGGQGQDGILVDPTRYSFENSYIEDNNPAGEIKLKEDTSNPADKYYSSGYFISSVFDTGAPSNFHEILWTPQDQHNLCKVDSVKMKIATSDNITGPWDFFGPDGTEDTYYTVSEPTIHERHDNHQYLRYKVYLSTGNKHYTPILSEVFFTYSTECSPPGQAFFSGLAPGDYDITVSLPGYTTYTDDSLVVDVPWQRYDVILNP